MWTVKTRSLPLPLLQLCCELSWFEVELGLGPLGIDWVWPGVSRASGYIGSARLQFTRTNIGHDCERRVLMAF